MRIQQITTDEATGTIIGDVYADIDSEWRIPDVRIGECMNDWADCLISLDGANSYTFHDHTRGWKSRLHRDGSEVLIQLHDPEGASCRLDYSAFRAEVLEVLRQYRGQLDHALPEHPGTSAYRRRLSHLEAQLRQT